MLRQKRNVFFGKTFLKIYSRLSVEEFVPFGYFHSRLM